MSTLFSRNNNSYKTSPILGSPTKGHFAGREYEDIQNKTFCKWLNARLEPQGYPPLTDLGRDFSDGTRLIQLIETLTDESLGRYNLAPVMRVQKAENVKMALERIREMGVMLTNIGPEDIVDGNRKLILGMIWSLVLRFTIADISEEGSHAKEGLLLWCQKKTRGYAGVDVQNFTRSFQDGRALCALVHAHRPDLLDFAALGTDPQQNTELAFSIAEEHLGIPRLLDVADVCSAHRPDERSVMTYVAQYFHTFATSAQKQSEAHTLNVFVGHINSLMSAIHDYERRARALTMDIGAVLDAWAEAPAGASYPRLKELQVEFADHKKHAKRGWFREKGDLAALLGHIQTKLRTYGMFAYEPAEGLHPTNLDALWARLLSAETTRSRGINQGIRDIKEALRMRFAEEANAFQGALAALSARLAPSDSPLEAQSAAVAGVQRELAALGAALEPLAAAEAACAACNVEENDYTVYAADDLAFEFDQLARLVAAQAAFIENQRVARAVTNITPEQLEEFEAAFKAFDKSESNTLQFEELVGALGSLGVSEFSLEDIVGTEGLQGGSSAAEGRAKDAKPPTTSSQKGNTANAQKGDTASSQGGAASLSWSTGASQPANGKVPSAHESVSVTFEQFIKYMVDRSEDRVTGEKVRSCFKSAAGEKPYLTELDLTRIALPEESRVFLVSHMAPVEVDEEESLCYDYEGFLDSLLE